MSIDYDLFYPITNLKRDNLLKIIFPILEEHGGELLFECYEMRYYQDLNSYRYEATEIEFNNLEEGIIHSQKWQGVNFEFKFDDGNLSILLWNDNLSITRGTTLTLSANSTLFHSLNEDAREWIKFHDLFYEIGKKLNSSFWFMDSDSSLKTYTIEDLMTNLKSNNFKNNIWVPKFVCIHRNLISQNEILKLIPNYYDFTENKGYYLLIYNDPVLEDE